LQNLRGWLDVADDITFRTDEILALRADALLCRWTHLGTDRASGGSYERPYIALWTLGGDGLVSHWEIFDPDRDAEALARFDTLTAEPLAPRSANAAWRAAERYRRACNEHNLAAAIALYASDPVQDDRRSIVASSVSGEAVFDNLRVIFAGRSLDIENTLLATRGDRLVLVRRLMRGEFGAGGPVEYDFLQVVEVDPEQRIVRTVLLDPGDLDAAYAELDQRFYASEATAHPLTAAAVQTFRSAFQARDWSALAFAADFVLDDHRPLGWGTTDTGGYLNTLRTLVELAPDIALRIDHDDVNAHGWFGIGTLIGTREGGSFEDSRVFVFEFDTRGQLRKIDFYSLAQLDAGRARFEELAVGVKRSPHSVF
jgi:hypothetical protein